MVSSLERLFDEGPIFSAVVAHDAAIPKTGLFSPKEGANDPARRKQRA